MVVRPRQIRAVISRIMVLGRTKSMTSSILALTILMRSTGSAVTARLVFALGFRAADTHKAEETLRVFNLIRNGADYETCVKGLYQPTFL